jgi:tetratricopeptide (TPR) repeat protein
MSDTMIINEQVHEHGQNVEKDERDKQRGKRTGTGKGECIPVNRRKGLRKIDVNIIQQDAVHSSSKQGSGSGNESSSDSNRHGDRNSKGKGILKKTTNSNTSGCEKSWQLLSKLYKRSSPTNIIMRRKTPPVTTIQKEEDPLAAIIEARNTQKVHFDLSKNKVYGASSSSASSSRLLAADDSFLSPLPQIKGIMKRIVFGTDMESNNDDVQSPSSLPSPTTAQTCTLLTTALKPKHKMNNKNKKETNKSMIDASAAKNNLFKEESAITNEINELIQKGKKAQHTKYQYPKASKYYLEAMSKLDQHAYPEYHQLRTATLQLLNDTHHAMRSLEHSADIVKMGLRHEEKNELLKALKMYTVAFRMRRDAVGKNHPTLPVLLNMLGSVQVKRGELKEAMQIFELALYGRLKSDNMRVVGKTNVNNGTKAVSMREMGQIHEMLGQEDDALEMYHESLECIIKRNEEDKKITTANIDENEPADDSTSATSSSSTNISECEICLVTAAHTIENNVQDGPSSPIPHEQHQLENQEMEVYIEDKSYMGKRNASNLGAFYNIFFNSNRLLLSTNISIHVAITLHHIANIHRKRQHYALALSSYEAALRGMKTSLGKKHPNVAAVLGNISNLHKDMKNYDLAYEIYQDVLKIESSNLGFGHPEVIVTMHNIAMIEKCRGNFKNSKSLYREVLSIQLGRKERTIKWYNSTAVTYSCLGDVEERDGGYQAAIIAYKEALSIRTQYIDKFHPDLGKLLHKIGVLNALHGNLRDASIYFAKAVRLYEFNNIEDSRLMVVLRDQADVLGKIAFNTSIV